MEKSIGVFREMVGPSMHIFFYPFPCFYFFQRLVKRIIMPLYFYLSIRSSPLHGSNVLHIIPYDRLPFVILFVVNFNPLIKHVLQSILFRLKFVQFPFHEVFFQLIYFVSFLLLLNFRPRGLPEVDSSESFFNLFLEPKSREHEVRDANSAFSELYEVNFVTPFEFIKGYVGFNVLWV